MAILGLSGRGFVIGKTSTVNWSDGDLRFGLQAVEHAERNPDEGFHPSGIDDEFALALLDELVRRGWVTVDLPLHGDDRLVAARGVRLASAGRSELIAWRQSDKLAREGMPAAPVEAWTKLRAAAEPFSPFARSVDEAQAQLIARGMFQSGPSIVRAMEVAYDHELTWEPGERTFVQRDRPVAVDTDMSVAQRLWRGLAEWWRQRSGELSVEIIGGVGAALIIAIGSTVWLLLVR